MGQPATEDVIEELIGNTEQHLRLDPIIMLKRLALADRIET